MDDALREIMEKAALEGYPFEAEPKWHFLFIENTEILKGLMDFFPEDCREADITNAVIAFSERSAAAAADANAGLHRMYAAAAGKTACRFSESFTLFFSQKSSAELTAALGVPEGYICAGAIVMGGEEELRGAADIRWNVFSYMK